LGSLDDIVLLYNAAPSAPSVWKNVRGDVVFQKDQASLCFAHTTPTPMARYVERIISEQGAKLVSSDARACDLGTAVSTIDILAFQRGELLKQKNEYILAWAKLMEGDIFQQYRVLADYARDFQKKEALSLQIEAEVSANARPGYGVIKVSETPVVCLVPPTTDEQLGGLKRLVNRDQYWIAPSLTSDWQFVQTTEDLAYRGLQRQQCGYVAAEAGVLGNLLQALHRDKFKYVFSPVWFDKADMEQATFDDRDRQQQAILKQHEDELKKAEADKLEQERRRKQEQQKTEIERRLREQNSVKARGLVNEIQELAQNLAENRVVNNHFPAYSNWLNQRFADQWETFQVTSDVADFGTVQWQGRTLEAIMVKSVIQQKNRILGRYSRDCFEFGFINDVEFAMERELFSVDCDKGKDFVKKWSIGNQFKSQGNVE
jgi:hypothetical protein